VGAEERAEVELALRRRALAAHGIPEERPAHVIGRALVVAEEGEERRVDLPHDGVVREKDLERTEGLELALTGAVVPGAEERPEVGFVRRSGGGARQATLFLGPEEEEQELLALVREIAVLPGGAAVERPEQPGLVGALDDRVGVDRRPAVDVALVAAALDEQRPEVTRLAISLGRGAVGVAEEGPEVGLVAVAGAGGAGVEGQKAEPHIGLGGGEVALGTVEQRPEEKTVAVVARAAALAGERPELKTAVAGAGGRADEGPRRVARVATGLFDVEIERERVPRQGVLAEALLDRAGDRQQRAVAGRGVARSA
jgi:hypothetical protein